MTNSEIQQFAPKEISQHIQQCRQDIFHYRLQQQAGELQKPHLLRIARRNIARLQTFLQKKKSL